MAQSLKRKRSISNSPPSDQDAQSDASDLSAHEPSQPSQPITHVSKPPTGQELRNIKDATDLYRSTSFKLQIDALLPNVSPKYNLSQPLDAFLLALHNCLVHIQSISPQHPLHAARSLFQLGIAIPYVRPLPTEDTNWKVAFEPPSEIVLAGSWAAKTAVKAKDGIQYELDVAVAMPSSLFQEKDYLNGRIFQKRAYYLSVLASAIAGAKEALPCDIYYQSTSDDPRCTTLLLRPEGGSLGKLTAQIRIVPFLVQSPIPLQRLSPSRSNLRTGTDDESKDKPTPVYNTTVMLLNTPKTHLLSLHASKQDIPAFADALTLLRVWANQRGYGLGNRMCVKGFEGKGMWWATILEFVVHGEEQQAVGFGRPAKKRKPLGKGLSSYQLFRAALDFLAKQNWAEERVFVKTKDGHRFPPDSYDSHDAVFVDSTSSVNLLAGVPLSSLDILSYDAKVTLAALDHSTISEDPFNNVFLQDHRDVFSRFDVVARVDISAAQMRNSPAHLVADCGSVYNALIVTLSSILRRGLGNRARAVAILHPSSIARSLSQALPVSSSVVHLGVILDADHAFRLVDHGPAAEDQESDQAKQFHDFWGEKAELRRFKDGSITESVVWNVSNADERAYVPAMIIEHLLHRHLGIDGNAIQTWQLQFDALLKVPESIRSIYQARSASGGFKAVLTAFDSLVKQIKALDDQLPLAILNVSPVSSALRYSEVFVPVAVPLASRNGLPPSASYLPAVEIIIEFEKSGRWPDDLAAIQKIKLALFERLASSLMGAVTGLQVNIVLGDSAERLEIQDEAALDIITPEGWAFRARIWHDREATLLDRLLDQPCGQAKRTVNGEEAHKHHAAVRAREVYTRRFIHAPRHHRAIAAVSHKFTAFSGTVRLAKRWFAAHWLLRSHVSEEAVELLCAYVFLRTGARVSAESSAGTTAALPVTKERGFAQLLELLKGWDWTKGLSVPLDYGEQEAAAHAVPTSPSNSVAWTLVTDFDPKGYMWTASGPNAVVARRVTAIAKAAWSALSGLESGNGNVKRLFEHPMGDYDLVVELKPAGLPRFYQNLDADRSVWAAKGKYVNAAPNGLRSETLPGFDPAAMFCNDLQTVYEDTALVFYDIFGGTRIGHVWQPSVTSVRPFRVLGGFSSIPVHKAGGKSKDKDKGSVVLNRGAVAAEIERLGAGLVSRLTCYREN